MSPSELRGTTVAIKPEALKEGARVALVAPSGRPYKPSDLNRCINIVEEMGFTPVVGKHCLDTAGHMAGSDEARLADLNEAIADHSIRGIFCLSAGAGALYLLNGIDYEGLRKNPKVLVGGHENCCILLACLKRIGLVSFVGPNLDEVHSQECFDRLKLSVQSNQPLPEIRTVSTIELSLSRRSYFTAVSGNAIGRLVGGNLTALSLLMGTPFQADLKQSILFIDDIDERTDILERWLTGLWAAGSLDQISGAALGSFDNCGSKTSHNLLSVEEQFTRRFRSSKRPCCFNFPIASGKNALPVPLSIDASLDADRGLIAFNESALL